MKCERATPVILICVLICLISEFGYALYHHFNYQERVNYGNARWEQVEERIREVEEGCGCERDS